MITNLSFNISIILILSMLTSILSIITIFVIILIPEALAVQPPISCIEMMTCKPDLGNPLSWLEAYGKSIGLPPEFGVGLLIMIIIGAVYIKTQNLALVSVGLMLIGIFFLTTSYSSIFSTLLSITIIVIASIILLMLYKLKQD